jgi:hypothetical protein
MQSNAKPRLVSKPNDSLSGWLPHSPGLTADQPREMLRLSSIRRNRGDHEPPHRFPMEPGAL